MNTIICNKHHECHSQQLFALISKLFPLSSSLVALIKNLVILNNDLPTQNASCI